MSRSGRGRATWILGGLVAVAALAAACGGPGEDQVATLSDTRPSPPITEPPEEMQPVEPAPAEPSPRPPPAEPTPPAAPLEGILEAESAAALVSQLAERPGVLSELVQVYISIQLSIDGVSAGSVSDVPYMRYTEVGDRIHVQLDQAAFATLSAFEDGMPPPAPGEGLPPIEIILDEGAQQAYVKVAPVAELPPAEQPSWLADLTVAPGAGLAEVWGRSGLDGGATELLPGLVAEGRPTLDDFLALLGTAPSVGGLLEARAEGAGEVAGVTTQVYAFDVDLADLAGEWPPFLEGFVSGAGTGGPPPDDFLALASFPAAVIVHADGAGIARLVRFDLDLGALLMAMFAGFEDMPDVEVAPPEIEYVLSLRFETLAVNDPALVVDLPDPSAIVELP